MALDPHPDRQRYAEWQAWAERALVTHLPANDLVRQAFERGEEIDAAWSVIVMHPPGGPIISHPWSGPTLMYPELGRWYRPLPTPVEHVVVGQLKDATGEDGEPTLDAGAAYVHGRSVVSLIDGRPDGV